MRNAQLLKQEGIARLKRLQHKRILSGKRGTFHHYILSVVGCSRGLVESSLMKLQTERALTPQNISFETNGKYICLCLIFLYLKGLYFVCITIYTPTPNRTKNADTLVMSPHEYLQTKCQHKVISIKFNLEISILRKFCERH